MISDSIRWKSPVIGITADRQDRSLASLPLPKFFFHVEAPEWPASPREDRELEVLDDDNHDPRIANSRKSISIAVASESFVSVKIYSDTAWRISTIIASIPRQRDHCFTFRVVKQGLHFIVIGRAQDKEDSEEGRDGGERGGEIYRG